MLPTKAALFQLISARMSWLSQRQAVLNQNIANADTPEYRPRDLRAADFTRLVDGALASRAGSPRHGPIERTSMARRSPGSGSPVACSAPRTR